MIYSTKKAKYINEPRDSFRELFGNGYHLVEGQGFQFQTSFPPETVIDQFDESGLPLVLFTEISNIENEIVHTMELRYNRRWTPIEPNIPGGVGGLDLIWSNQGQDVDGESTEYVAPEIPSPESFPPTIEIEGSLAGVPSGGGIPQGDKFGIPQGVNFGPGLVLEHASGQFEFVPNGNPTGGALQGLQDAQSGVGDIYSPQNPNILPQDQTVINVPSALEQLQNSLQNEIVGTFLDAVFEANKPFTLKELKQIQIMNTPAIVDVSSEYLYYDEAFETNYLMSSVTEKDLPNFYSVLASGGSGNLELSKQFLTGDFSTKANIAFLEDEIAGSDLVNNKAFLLPAFNQIEQTCEESQLATQLTLAKLNNVFGIDYLRKIMNDYSEFSGITYIESEQRFINSPTSQVVYTNNTKRAKYYKFTDWVSQIINVGDGLQDELTRREMNDITLFDIDGVNVVTLNGFDEINLSNIWDVYAAALSLFRFQDYLQIFSRQFARSYPDIWSGKLGYAEPLLYVVVKKDKDTQKVLQRFLLWGNSTNVLKYIDTQIKYGKTYQYEFNTHYMLNATRYNYENLREWSKERNSVICDVRTKTELLIVEIPVQIVETTLLDAIPSTPQVSMIPYRDYPERMLITLGENGGGTEITPYGFSDETWPATVIPKDDDYVTEYEVYRVTDKPKSWDDFRNGVKTTLSTKYFTGPNQYIMTPSVSFVDTILANTDYYYIFRCKDVHGHMSSFGDIFYIHTIAQGSRHIPIIRTISSEVFDSNKYDYRRKLKTAQRYIMIAPAYLQAVIDKTSIPKKDSINEIPEQVYKLGIASASPWNKKYKLRIRSKQSGRVIDVNFSFKQELFQ